MANGRTRKDNEDEIRAPHLPENVIQEIFARLPQECLAELRYVCRSWYKMISWNKFIADSFHLSRPALLMQVHGSCHSKRGHTKLLELDSEGLRFKQKQFVMSRMGKARSHCNGLLLVNDKRDSKNLVVMNVLTKCYVTVPLCPSYCPHRACGSALVFNPHEKSYKVVHVYNDGFGFEIFTLGCPENEWKVVPGPFYRVHERPYGESFRWSGPFSTNGQLILHWDVDSRDYFISFDVCEERFSKTSFPCCFKEGTGNLLEMGGNISFMHRISSTQFDVWALEDFELKIWKKNYSISAESISGLMSKDIKAVPSFENLVPLISMRNGGIIVFQHKSSFNWYLYQRNHEVLKKVTGMPMKTPKLLLYKSSLVCWKNMDELLVRETI